MGQVEVGVIEPVASRIGLRRRRTQDVGDGKLVTPVLDPQVIPSNKSSLEEDLDGDEAALQIRRRLAEAAVEIKREIGISGPGSKEDLLEPHQPQLSELRERYLLVS